MHAPTTRRGFTLVEMLIALAMISLITLLLFSGLRLGSRAWESVDGVSERMAEVRAARGFLMRALTQARSANVTFDAEQRPVFSGDAQRLEFVAPLSDHVGLPGLYILRLGIEDDGAQPVLVLTRWLLHPEVLDGPDGVPAWSPLADDSAMGLDGLAFDLDTAGGAFGRTLLLENPEDFAIAYFGIAEGESEPDWYEEWLDQPELPLLVQIHLRTPEQSWPDLAVALPDQVSP